MHGPQPSPDPQPPPPLTHPPLQVSPSVPMEAVGCPQLKLYCNHSENVCAFQLMCCDYVIKIVTGIVCFQLRTANRPHQTW